MAQYGDLTTEQKGILDAWLNAVRAWTGEQAQTNNHSEALWTGYNGQVSAILALLDVGALIPNEGGLSGAASVTKEEVVSVASHMDGVLTGYNTEAHRQLWVKFCGPDNLIG